MNAEAEERPLTGKDWAEQYLPAPVPASDHHASFVPLPLAKAAAVERRVIAALGAALLLAAIASVVLTAIGVQP